MKPLTQAQSIRGIFLLYTIAVAVALVQLFPKPLAFLHKKKTQSGSLAIVHIYGPIKTNLSASPWGSPDADAIAHQLHRISEDDEVKAILLRINSPGGTVGGVQEIYTELQKCKAKGKIIVASFGDVAASGGYYLATAADRIISNPGTITGSIGVIMEFGNLEGLMQKIGVKLEVVKSGLHKDIGSPARPLTSEEKALLQASIDDAYAQFVEAVSKGRHLSMEKTKALADGRIFTGQQAIKAGLVDGLGDKEDAIEVAIRLAHLPEHPTLVSDNPKSLSGFLKQLNSEVPWKGLETLSNSPDVSLEYRLR